MIVEKVLEGVPRFEATGLINRHLLISCYDEPAKVWLTKAVEELKKERHGRGGDG